MQQRAVGHDYVGACLHRVCVYVCASIFALHVFCVAHFFVLCPLLCQHFVFSTGDVCMAGQGWQW